MSAAGKGGFPQGPQIGGGPAPIQQPSQPDIYTRYGGQQNVDSDPNLDGYQPPTSTPMQPPAAQPAQPAPTPGMPGGKSGGGKGGFGPGLNIPRPDIGPGVGIGGGPAQLDPNAPNPLGPEGQQPVTPQPPGGTPGFGGKSGFNPSQFARTMEVRPGEEFQGFKNTLF